MGLRNPPPFDAEETALVEAIRKGPVPRHIALIMDGNGRWARKISKERLFGHHEGRETVRMVLRTSRQLGVEAVTLYTFSSENWNRSRVEVEGLMRLLQKTMASEEEELFQAGVRMRLLGRLDRLPEGVRDQMLASQERLSQGENLTMALAIDYGGRDEIVRVARALAEDARAGTLDPEAIDEELFASRLDSRGLPDPELLIRTGGEVRVSNYLLWQAAYSEFVFSEKLWPEFLRLDYLKAILSYQNRDRRFGGHSSC